MAISKSTTYTGASFTTVEDANTVDVSQRTDVAVHLTGTWAGTVTFEVSIDGTNWVSLAMLATTQTANATRVASATANGMFVADVTPYKKFRARYSTDTSGTVVCRIYRATRGGIA